MRAPWDVLEPAARGEVQREERAVGRVERFTGVVFGVAMALLVLSLVVPQLTGQLEDATLRGFLAQMLPAFLTFLLSFSLLATIWVLHHFQFNYLVRSSGGLLWLNAVLVVFVALVPFSTALLSTYGITTTAVLLYEANLLAIQALLLLNWRQAVRTGLLFGGNVPAAVVRRMRVALTAGTACVLATIPLSLISPHMGLGLLAGLAAFYIFLTARGGYTLDAFKRRTAPPPDVPWPL